MAERNELHHQYKKARDQHVRSCDRHVHAVNAKSFCLHDQVSDVKVHEAKNKLIEFDKAIKECIEDLRLKQIEQMGELVLKVPFA